MEIKSIERRGRGGKEDLKFIICGKAFDLTRQKVINKMKECDAERISIHAVKIDGRLFPIKQVFSEVTGIPRVEFTSQQAYQVLRRLGFDLRVKKKG